MTVQSAVTFPSQPAVQRHMFIKCDIKAVVCYGNYTTLYSILFTHLFSPLLWCALMSEKPLSLFEAIQHSINTPFALWHHASPGTWLIWLFLLCQSIMNHTLICIMRGSWATSYNSLPVKLHLHTGNGSPGSSTLTMPQQHKMDMCCRDKQWRAFKGTIW